MSELSDADGFGSRQTRRGASMARSVGRRASARRHATTPCAADRRWMPREKTDAERVRAKSAETPRRAHSKMPSAAGFAAASRAEPSRTRRFAQDCDPKTYLCMSSGRKDAEIARPRRRARLRRIMPQFGMAAIAATVSCGGEETRSRRRKRLLPEFG